MIIENHTILALHRNHPATVNDNFISLQLYISHSRASKNVATSASWSLALWGGVVKSTLRK